MATYKCVVYNTGGVGLRSRNGPALSYKQTGLYQEGFTFTATQRTTNSSEKTTWYKMSDDKWLCGIKNGKSYLKVTSDSSSSASTPVPSTPSAAKISTPAISSGGESLNTSAITQAMLDMTKLRNTSLEDAIDGSVRLFGLPHQFTAYTDHRVSNKTKLGRVFTETFLLDAPLVYIKPGTSNFLPGKSKADKEGFMNALRQLAGSDNDAAALKNKLINMGNDQKNIKYFEFEQRYVEAMSKVNMLCRIGAVFLGIHKEKVPWAKSDKVTFGNYDWRYYRFKSTFENAIMVGDKPESALNGFNVANFLSSISNDDSYIQFYVDAGTSFSESASNSTSQSMITQVTDSLSSMGKELAYISGATGVNMDDLIASGVTEADQWIQENATNGAIGSFIKRIVGSSSSLLVGGNFIAPDFWSDSDYSKQYGFDVTLATPYGNKKSWYLNIWVPLAHILALSLPSQLGANAFTAPPLVKVFAPGWFSCDLGIIDSISITKVMSGDAWSSEGLPLEMRVNIGVKDLYSKLALPANYSITDFFNNDNLISFLLVSCGVDISNQGLLTKLDVFLNMFANTFREKLNAPFQEVVVAAKEMIRNWWSFKL